DEQASCTALEEVTGRPCRFLLSGRVTSQAAECLTEYRPRSRPWEIAQVARRQRLGPLRRAVRNGVAAPSGAFVFCRRRDIAIRRVPRRTFTQRDVRLKG